MGPGPGAGGIRSAVWREKEGSTGALLHVRFPYVFMCAFFSCAAYPPSSTLDLPWAVYYVIYLGFCLGTDQETNNKY